VNKVLLKYNNLTHLDADYQHRVMDLGDFYQQLPFDTDFKVYYVTDLDHAVRQLDPYTDWVVVVAAGHCTQDRNIYDKLIIEAMKQSSPLIGHILNFKDQYPHIHPQLFAFNYQEWTKAGYPLWEYSAEAETFVANDIKASEETFHDEYTPHWIESSGLAKEYNVKEMQVGAEAIREFVEMGYRIVNVPEHIRKNKFHLYPDQQWQAFKKFLYGQEYSGTVYEQKHYAGLIGHLDNQVQQQYYVLNTEPLQRPLIDTKIDHYIGVAAGLKLVATMIKNEFNYVNAVTYFDFSQHALEFQRYIHDYWDGDVSTYEQTCNNFKVLLPNGFVCEPRGTYIENLEYLLNEIGCTAEEFQTYWQKYKLIKPEFIHLNLYNRADQLKIANMCVKFNTNYLWVSNAFWMEYSLIKHGKQNLKELRDNLFLELKNSKKRIILDIEDTWHQGIITFNN
jgi:hypothetical protein